MSSKNTAQPSGTGRFLFSSFNMARNGAMVVDRNKLHASEGYKRQIEALNELKQKRERSKVR